jgi:hypothetical protein
MTALPVDTLEALKFIATATFRPFTEIDWMGWQGCNSDNPMIAEVEELVIIVDGDEVTFNVLGEKAGDIEWANFKLNLLGFI